METAYRLEIIQISKIEFGDRAREEYNEIKYLAESIAKHGIIQPICVCLNDESAERKYKLLAGGRRLTAAIFAKVSEVPAKVYTSQLDPLTMKEVELEENINRDDFSWSEKVKLTQQIHLLKLEKYGEATAGGKSGHRLSDTGRILQKSRTSVQRDLDLAEALEMYPELVKAKNATEARSLLEHIRRRHEEKKSAENFLDTNEDEVKSRLINAYIKGDFFEKVKVIPNGMVQLVEADPPYGIDADKVRKITAGDALKKDAFSSYEEVGKEEYPEFLKKMLEECYRIMTRDSWIIFWCAIDWMDHIKLLMMEVGFSPAKLPALWVKTKCAGQTQQPKVVLGSACEYFIYARKGHAEIRNQGRTNLFSCDIIHAQKKVHPMERPVELIQEVLRTFAGPGINVCVPFLGSGNSLLAAANLNMNAYGFDLDEEGMYKNSYIAKVEENKPPDYRSLK